jgi:mono/diheme cytochrome c family protein
MTALHHLVVGSFLLFYAYKIGLLLANRPDLLHHLRARLAWLDGVLGAAVLLTGGYLALQYAGPWPWWLVVKIGLVLAGLPLALVALRRGQRVLAGATLLLFAYVYGLGYTRSLDLTGRGGAPATAAVAAVPDSVQTGGLIGKLAYQQNCIRCHGRNGDMCLYGARNLQQSTVGLDARIALIRNGRGRMPAFYPRLTPEEIGAVARYSMTLYRKKKKGA